MAVDGIVELLLVAVCHVHEVVFAQWGNLAQDSCFHDLVVFLFAKVSIKNEIKCDNSFFFRNFGVKIGLDMKIAVIQHVIRVNQLQWNLLHLASLMDQQPGADLYVLSEMFATGFMADATTRQAGIQAPQILHWMQQQAQRLDAAIVGSVATADDKGLLRNRLLFVRPDGSCDYYDKRHLFGYAGEDEAYEAGQQRVVVAWRGVRFLLQVCYDLRFPVFSRNRGDYDAIVYVACWPQTRRDVWQTLLKARALENQCFVAGVNMVGSDGTCLYQGDSVVIDAYGHILAQCTPGEEGTAIAELDMDALRRFRRKFPVLNDADEFVLT